MVELSSDQIDECTRDIKRRHALEDSLHKNGFDTTIFEIEDVRIILQICRDLGLNLCDVEAPGVILLKNIHRQNGIFGSNPGQPIEVKYDNQYQFDDEAHRQFEFGDIFSGMIIGGYEIAYRISTPRSNSHDFIYFQILGIKKVK